MSLVTAKDLCKRLDVSYPTLMKMVKMGQIPPPVPVGEMQRYDLEATEEALKRGSVGSDLSEGE